MFEPIVDKNFQLEQGILRCWGVVEDLEDLANSIRGNYTKTEDVIKMLECFQAIYQMRFEQVFGVYEEVCKGLHELRKERDALDLELRTTRFDEANEHVAKKPHAKMAKSKKAKAVDQ